MVSLDPNFALNLAEFDIFLGVGLILLLLHKASMFDPYL